MLLAGCCAEFGTANAITVRTIVRNETPCVPFIESNVPSTLPARVEKQYMISLSRISPVVVRRSDATHRYPLTPCRSPPGCVDDNHDRRWLGGGPRARGRRWMYTVGLDAQLAEEGADRFSGLCDCIARELWSTRLETVDLDGLGIKLQPFLLVDEEFLHIFTLIALKLDHLAHLGVNDDGAIAGELLLDDLEDLLLVKLLRQSLDSSQGLAAIALLNTNMNVVLRLLGLASVFIRFGEGVKRLEVLDLCGHKTRLYSENDRIGVVLWDPWTK